MRNINLEEEDFNDNFTLTCSVVVEDDNNGQFDDLFLEASTDIDYSRLDVNWVHEKATYGEAWGSWGQILPERHYIDSASIDSINMKKLNFRDGNGNIIKKENTGLTEEEVQELGALMENKLLDACNKYLSCHLDEIANSLSY